MTAKISDALLDYDCVCIHAVAISNAGKAWLIAADPGVGKSTQIHYLNNLFPNEFAVICGDRPILEFENSGEVIVHPSPWNGKEGWHGAPAAPLAGILCLKRGETTSIRKLKPREAVIPVLTQLISMRETEESVKKLAELETKLLKTVPVYEYINGGVPDSTRILYRFLSGDEEYHEV